MSGNPSGGTSPESGAGRDWVDESVRFIFYWEWTPLLLSLLFLVPGMDWRVVGLPLWGLLGLSLFVTQTILEYKKFSSTVAS